MKRFAAILLSMCIIFSMVVPVIAYAQEQPEVKVITFTNPLYNDQIVIPPLLDAVESGPITYYTSIEDAGAALCDGMQLRQANITIGFKTMQSAENGYSMEIFNQALVHTGDPTEGDYQKWHYSGGSIRISGIQDGDYYYYDITYNIGYYTTAQQEQELDMAVVALLDQLDVYDASDYGKIRAVYDYLCQNITYNYDALETKDPHAHTAHAALIDKTAVCQGYASLLYRLLLELGVDTRLIAGIGNGGDHGWNIAGLNGWYYNLDATWDANYSQAGYPYEFFLRCEDNFSDHYRSSEYQTSEFNATYPMSPTDYTAPTSLQITKQPTSVTVANGAEAKVTFTATGDGLTYKWYYKDKDASSFSYDGKFTGNTYTKEMNSSCNGRQIYCVVTDKYGNKVQTNTVTISMPVQTIVDSGTCGDNLTWTLDDAGTLTISGTGPMYDYTEGNEGDVASPWRDNTFEIDNILINDGVTRIGNYAFDYCRNVPEIIIPDSVTSIGDHAFSWCSSLSGVTIPDSVTNIGNGAFYKCTGLTSIAIPDSVTSIGGGAFAGCTSLTSVTIPDSVTSIGESAFSWCDSLTSITIPDSVTSIGDWAFGCCSSLTGITIPDSVTSIGNHAFDYCTSLTSVTIGEGVTSIDDDAFYGCFMLQDVYYNATQKQWNAIEIGDYNYCLTGATLHMKEAVKITKQPKSVIVGNGKAVNISVGVTGDGLTYKWYYKEKGQSAFTYTATFKGNSYDTTMTAARNGRQVYCVITDKYGNSVRTNTVTMSIPANVKITRQPVSTAVANNATVNITVNATGDGLTYKWYYKNKGASAFTLTTTFTGNTYTAQMNANRDGRQVYCVVTDKYGNSVKSNTATMTMKNPLKITKQPASVSVANNKALSIKVSATGDGLRYQWYYKDKGQSTFKLTTTFTGNSYNTTMTAARNGRQVYCVVTDKYGNSVKSNTATMTMKNPLKITKQPASVSVANNKALSIKVSATGDGLTYQWYYKDKGQSAFKLTTTFTGNSYDTTMTAARNGRQVYCVVTDKYGNSIKTNTVAISMQNKAKITKQPTAVSVANGKNATVSFTATGDGLTYKWYFKDKGASAFRLTTTFTGNTYTAQMNADRNGRQVYCVVTDKYGNSVKTNTVTISMQNKEKITKQPTSVSVANGKNATVSFTATGDGLTYKWYFKDKGASAFKLTTTFTGKTYSAQMNAARNGRQIYCVVTDKYGNSVKTNTVTISMK